MKILNKKEFVKMPEGTLFSYYTPCYFGALCLKSTNNDFKYTRLRDCYSRFRGIPDPDLLQGVQSKYIDLPMAPNNSNNNYEVDSSDSKQLFAVWTKDDIDSFIEILITQSRLAFDGLEYKQHDWINL